MTEEITCKLDSFSTKNKKSLSNHMRWHRGEYGYGFTPWNKGIKLPFEIWNKGVKGYKLKLTQEGRNRMIKAHLGKPVKQETKVKLRESHLGSKNPMWKGDKVGYHALHAWIKNRKPKTNTCENCKLVPPKDLANISGEYKRDLSDWEWLCRKCHMTKDGRLYNLKQYGK